MTAALTDAWFEAVTLALAELPKGPGGSGVAEIRVSGGDPDRLVTRWVVEDGRLTSVGLADGGDFDVCIPQSRADIEAIVSGDRDPAVAFMRGDLKPEGSAGALLALLSALARADTKAVLRG